MRNDLYNKISDMKRQYETEGFVIIGVFGSFARGDEDADSDIDILYECHEPFISRYRGWETFGRIGDIKKELSHALGREVDLANREALDDVGRKFILPEVVYVS